MYAINNLLTTVLEQQKGHLNQLVKSPKALFIQATDEPSTALRLPIFTILETLSKFAA
jgi:hypothetical protein